MAPEQFRAEGRISPSTDIYALGMLAYTLLVGVHYWMSEHERCDNPFAFASIAVHGPKEAPSIRAALHGVMLPQSFDDWFFKATSRWPQDRFPSATTMIGELSRVLSVEVPQLPVSLPITGTGPISSTTGTPMDRVLPATIESPSARFTGGGLHATGETAEDSGVELTREQHTEHSLSVTSGGLPFKLVAPAPRRFPVGAAVAAVVLAAVVVVMAVVRSWQTDGVVGTPKERAAAQPTATPATSTTPIVEKARDVTRIEELPLAPPEHNHVVSGVDPAGTSKGTRPKPTRPPRVGAVTPPPAAGAQPAAPASKPVVRESLYGRD
jgi:serine/threonine-protein kinase